MKQTSKQHTTDELRGVTQALQRAAHRAKLVAKQTGTPLVVRPAAVAQSTNPAKCKPSA